MKIDKDTLITVLLAMVIYAILDKVVLNKIYDKIGVNSYEVDVD